MVALKSLVSLLPLIAVPASAAPNYLRIPGSATDLAAQAFDSAQSWIHGAISEAKTKWDAIEAGKESKISSEMVVENGIECQKAGLVSSVEMLIRNRHGLDPPRVPLASTSGRPAETV